MILKGKNCLITGTNRGLGKALVRKFALEGANIWAHARKYSSQFELELQELEEEFSVSIKPMYFDLLDETAIKSTVQLLFKAKIRIDVLINNAGVAHGGLFQMTPVDKMKEIYETNYFAPLRLTQMIVKLMLRQHCGAIVNIASIAGMDLAMGNCAYGMSKLNMIGITQVLAKELTPAGVRVNAVAPGLLETDMANQMELNAYQEMVEKSLMKRLGKPEEVANVVAFLASDQASFLSGQIIRVDGGQG